MRFSEKIKFKDWNIDNIFLRIESSEIFITYRIYLYVQYYQSMNFSMWAFNIEI